MNTRVEVRAIDATSSAASRVETATYFATEPGACVRDGEVVVDGLRYADTHDRQPELRAELRDLVSRVHRVAAAVVEEVPDVVGPEHLDEPLVLGAVRVEPLELVARGAERAARRVPQGRDGARGLGRRIDHVFRQRAEDSVAPRVDAAELVLVLARRLDDAAGARVDDRRDAARLSVENVLFHEPSERCSTLCPENSKGGLRLTKVAGVASVTALQRFR
jgi:hypothetical protein